MTLREAYCARLGIPADAFEEEVLRECLFPHARPLGRLLRRLRRGYFDLDLDLIRAVGDCATLTGMGDELNDHLYHHPVSGFWRRLLRARLSGRRLMALGAELLG